MPVTVRPVPTSLVKTDAPLSAVLADVTPRSLAAVGVTVRFTPALLTKPAESCTV